VHTLVGGSARDKEEKKGQSHIPLSEWYGKEGYKSWAKSADVVILYIVLCFGFRVMCAMPRSASCRRSDISEAFTVIVEKIR
jgi:hypothetical protein